MQGKFWIMTATATGMAATLISGSAFARTDVSVNIGIPGPAIIAPGPVYAPPPVYYGPPPRYWRGPPPGHWRHHGGWDRRDYGRGRGWDHRR